jgi:hypothetical protein
MPIARVILAFAAAAIGMLVIAPVLVLVLPFWIVSVITRAAARVVRFHDVGFDQVTEYDPVFGWRPRPNLQTLHGHPEVFQLTTGPDGWRGRSTLENAEIVVFGDSFAAGFGVDDDQFFANLPGTPPIKAVGFGGYCLVQELLWMKRVAPSLKGKLVIWLVFYGNDLYDSLNPDMLGYRKPFVRERGASGEWEIVSSHLSPDRWPICGPARLAALHYLPRLADLCSETFLSARAYSACEFLLREGQKVCESVGADLVVMSVPEPLQLSPEGVDRLKRLGGDPTTFDERYPDRQVQAMCGRLGLPFVAGTSFLNAGDYLENDCHWNSRGHRRVADCLTNIYLSQPRRPSGQLKTASSDIATALSGAARA